MIHVPADLSEKRWSPRQHMILPIQCQLSREDDSAVGWVTNLSSTGAGVISNLTLTAGDELTVTLTKESGPDMKIGSRVRWKQGQLLGVEFQHTPWNRGGSGCLDSLYQFIREFLYHPVC